MKKLAIFVEGQTEQIFLREYIDQLAGLGNILFECQSKDNIVRLTQTAPAGTEGALVLLYNCQSDGAVKSTIIDQRDSLARAGYSLVLGLRDLYPSALADLAVVKAKLNVGIPTGGVPTHVLLAVAEVEAWFLQEYNHFSRIHNTFDLTKFKADFGFDPRVESSESIATPAALLHSIYSTVGFAYKKRFNQVRRTVGAMDFENLYLNCGTHLPHLVELSTHIENFLAPDLA